MYPAGAQIIKQGVAGMYTEGPHIIKQGFAGMYLAGAHINKHNYYYYKFVFPTTYIVEVLCGCCCPRLLFSTFDIVVHGCSFLLYKVLGCS